MPFPFKLKFKLVASFVSCRAVPPPCGVDGNCMIIQGKLLFTFKISGIFFLILILGKS